MYGMAKLNFRILPCFIDVLNMTDKFVPIMLLIK